MAWLRADLAERTRVVRLAEAAHTAKAGGRCIEALSAVVDAGGAV